MTYLNERKQYVYINGNKSDTLLTGNISVSQGSIVSGLFYLIYTLDMHMITHKYQHKSHQEYVTWKRDEMNVYVDDCYAIIEQRKDLWQQIKDYIILMENYYTSNQLCINVKKKQQ